MADPLSRGQMKTGKNCGAGRPPRNLQGWSSPAVNQAGKRLTRPCVTRHCSPFWVTAEKSWSRPFKTCPTPSARKHLYHRSSEDSNERGAAIHVTLAREGNGA